MSEKKKITD